jgi:hypothetical protein
LFIFPPLTLVILCPPSYSLWSPPQLCSGSRVHPVSTTCAAFSLISPPLKSGAESCSCAERFDHRLSVLALKLPGSSSSWQERTTKVASFLVKLPGTLDSRSACFMTVLLAFFFFCCCLPLRFVSPRRGAHCLSLLLGFVPFCRRSFLLDF